MAKCEPPWAQLRFERRPVHAGLDARRSRRPVDLEDTIERTKIDADGTAIRLVDIALNASDDRRSTAVGNRGNVFVGAPVEERDDVVLGARHCDQIGRRREVAVQRTPDVAERLAVGVAGPFAGIVSA